MKNRLWLAAVAVLLGGVLSARAGDAKPMTEKEKALANPYPNDYGPDRIADDVLKTYPADAQEGYHILIGEKKGKDGKWASTNGKSGCVQCHTASRPLNSRFLEVQGGTDEAKQKAALDALKKANPEIFADKTTWQPEVRVWSRYVKRMMSKPGCSISPAEGKAIYTFLVQDGIRRKTGENAAKWAAHRKELVGKLKAEKPARYEELKAANDL